MTGRVVYGMFFLSRNFVCGFLYTLKSKKNFRNLKTFLKKNLGFFPALSRTDTTDRSCRPKPRPRPLLSMALKVGSVHIWTPTASKREGRGVQLQDRRHRCCHSSSSLFGMHHVSAQLRLLPIVSTATYPRPALQLLPLLGNIPKILRIRESTWDLGYFAQHGSLGEQKNFKNENACNSKPCKSRAIAGRTAQCYCKFRYESKFTAASHGFHRDSNAFEFSN